MSTLAGKRIAVTRAAHQAGELAALLRANGAVPLLYPCVAISPPTDTHALDAALRGEPFAWALFTSANSVRAVAQRLATLGLGMGALAGAHIAAVGPATAAAVQRELGLATTTIPERFDAASLAQALPDLAGERVFLPQSAIAEPLLADALAQADARLAAVVAYENGVGAGGVDLPALLAARQVDAITLTSASCASGLLARLAAEGGDIGMLADVPIACIGPSTARAALALGLRVGITPGEHTLAGLIAALEDDLA